MKINPTKINRKDLIKIKDIPKGTRKLALVTYLGHSVLMPVEYLASGQYRIEFIKKYGVPLPKVSVPEKPEEFFCPNISTVI